MMVMDAKTFKNKVYIIKKVIIIIRCITLLGIIVSLLNSVEVCQTCASLKPNLHYSDFQVSILFLLVHSIFFFVYDILFFEYDCVQ